MSTPPPIGYERLLTPADLLGADARLGPLVQPPATATVSRVTRLGPLVVLSLDVRCTETAWTSGNTLLTLPAWAHPWTTLYLPPPYSNVGGAMIATSLGDVRWYYNGTTPGARFHAAWHTEAPMP